MARRRKKPPPLPPVPPRPIGADGWPLNYDKDAAERAFERPRAENEAAFMKADAAFMRACERAVVKERYFPALMDAFAFCGDRNLPLPSWLHAVIWVNLDHAYRAKAKNWKRHEAETKRREKHWQRYLDVEELLERRDEARDPNQRYDLARTRNAVFDAVAERHGVSRSAIENSYWTNKRAIKTPDGAPYVARYRARAAGVKNRRKKR